jgi:hypothetical protein
MAKQPRQQRVGFYGEFRPTGIDDSAARRMQALAGLGATVAGVAEQFGIAKAEELAPLKAKKAIDEATSIDPETGKITLQKVERKTGLGWGKDAYNAEIAVHEEAIKQKYLTDISNDTATSLGKLFDENLNDPENFNTLAQELVKGVVSGVSPEYQSIVASSLNQDIFNNTEKLRSNKRMNDIAQTIQEGVDNLNSSVDEITLASRNGEDVTKQVDQTKLKIKGLSNLSPEQKKQETSRLEALDKQVYESRIAGELNRLTETEGEKEAYAKLIEIENNPQKGYSGPEWQTFINNQKTQITKTGSLINAGNEIATAEFNATVKEYENKASLGFAISESEQAKMTAKVAGTKYEAGVAMANELAQFAVKPVSKRKELIAQAKKSGNATLTNQLEILNNRLQTEIATDAFSLGMKQGYVDYTTLNVADILSGTDEEAKQAFRTRKTDAGLLSQIYGTNVSVFTQEEASQLTAALPSMDVQQKMRLATVLGEDSGVWAQISKDPAVGAFAQVSALGNNDVSRIVFTGEERVRLDPSVKLKGIDETNALNILDEIVGEGIYGANDKKSVFQAASAYYYGANSSRDMLDQDMWKASIQAVTGGIEKVRDHPTQLTKGVTANDLDLYFSTITSDDLETMGAKQIIIKTDASKLPSDLLTISPIVAAFASPLLAKEEKENLTLNKVHQGRVLAVEGKGNYVITVGSEVVSKPDGSPLIFNVTPEKIADIRGSEKSRQFDLQIQRERSKEYISPSGVAITIPSAL